MSYRQIVAARLADWRGKRRVNAPDDPAELVIVPPVDATAEPLPDGRWRLAWRLDAARVTVAAGARPAGPWTVLAEVDGAKTAVVAVDPPRPRPYFRLALAGGAADGQQRVLAARDVPLPNGFNLRDVGGYAAADGRRVRWGQLFRGGSLAALAAADHAVLAALDLRLVCDLRTAAEARAAPDRLPAGARGLHLPLASSAGRRAQAETLRRYRRQTDALLRHIYTRELIDDNAAQFGALLRLLADPANRPALIHCAVGKDRTGVAVALLLALLGVPDEVIVAEYSLSNQAHAAIAALMRPAFRRAWWAGVRPSRLEPLLLAEPRTMRAALAHLRRQYGSAEAYAHGAAGVAPETLAALRAALLEP